MISYLTALPSRDLIRAAHQQITREWWARRSAFDLFVSQAVIREISRGDAGAAADRIAAVRFLPVLAVDDETEILAEKFVGKGGLPAKAAVDAIHIAVAAVNGIDYLLTGNCTHIANAVFRDKIEQSCREAGLRAPTICTPEELMEV